MEIKYTDDGKGKYQSCEARAEIELSARGHVANISIFGYGYTEEEARDAFKCALKELHEQLRAELGQGLSF